MVKHFVLASALALSLSACAETLGSVGAIFGAEEFFQDLAEKGEGVADEALEQSAKGYDFYCGKVPKGGQERLNERFNEKLEANGSAYRMPKWCIDAAAVPLPE